MTVSSDLNRISYSGNGSTTVFPVNYYFLEDSHLQVILITAAGVETIQTLTTNYTVSGAGNPAGGSVTMLVAPPTGTTIVIQRDVPATQETDYLANDPFPAESHERALDKLTMLVQQNEREADRALKIPLAAVPTTSTELPLPEGNKLLAWNSNASAVTNFDPSDVITIVGQQTSYGDVFTGNGVTTDFTLTRSPGSVFGLDVSINGVTQVPNVDYILAGTTLTFTSAPPAAASQILARYAEVYEEVSADAQNVRYLPAGTGAQLTTVQAKLRETVSVKDFGAVGDGATNNIAAFITAAASLTDGDSLFIPDGDYVFDFSGYTVASPVYPTQGIVNLVNKTGIKIYGTGAKLRITNLNTQTKGGWSIVSLDNCSDIEISGLQFDIRGVTGISVAAPDPNYPIIACVNATGLTWQNLTVNGCKFTSFNPLGAAPNPSGNDFNYKQIPVYVSGDTNADAVRGFTFTNNIMGDGSSDMNTYKLFLLGVGNVKISDNSFVNISGLYPCVRNLIHASRGHVISNNYFQGLNPADNDAGNNVVATDTPSMVQLANSFGKGGGGATIESNVFAITGSGGVDVDDADSVSVVANAFYDFVDMSSVFTIEDDTVSCVRVINSSFHVNINDNVVRGVITRKFAQITSGVNGSICNNQIDSSAGYAIKLANAPNYNVSNNDIADVSLFDGTQIGISINSSSGVIDAGQRVICQNNILHNFSGSTGTGIGTVNYNPDRVFIAGNQINGVTSELSPSVNQQYYADHFGFNNDPALVSSKSNVLDWYEEGTFTPVVSGSSSAGVGTYTTQIGKFTRIGDLVHFQISVIWTAHTGTGNTLIQFLPYAPESTSGELMLTDIVQSGGPIPAAGSIRIAVITPGSTDIGLREQVLSTMTVTNSNPITATGAIYVSGSYKV